MRVSSIRALLMMFCLAILHAFLAYGAGNTSKSAAIVSLRIVPQDVTIFGAQAAQQFVVLAQCADGLERDVTSQAHFSLSAKDRGEIVGAGKFVAHTSGELSLTAKAGGRSAKTAIHIEDADKPRSFTFARDIGGILTKRGCNDTSCHGSVKGRNGFKLSVYAQSPREDYQWIVEGGTFRVLTLDADPKIPRINVKDPKQSLLLLKPTSTVPHGGGVRFEVGSPDYTTFLNWIQSGAPYGDEAEKQGDVVKRVEVYPTEIVLGPQGRQQLVVTAYLANGRREDITGQSHFVAEDAEVADVNDAGLVEGKKAGESNVFVRAAGGYALSVTVGVVNHGIPNYPKLEARNYIDQLVYSKLRRFQLLPSKQAGDEEFLRRLCLDLTGSLPPPRRVREFLADADPHKRDKLIELLLNSPEYVDYFCFRFSDLMRVALETTNNQEMTKSYQDWIIHSLIANKPFDQMARERIAAQGNSAAARNFHYIAGQMTSPEVLMPELVRLFMGRRIECAQCHNHPFESWTQNQFWGLTAFLGGLTTVSTPGTWLLIDSMNGGHVDQTKESQVINPRTKKIIPPTFLDGSKLSGEQLMDPRKPLAEWMTAHPYFAEASVNRVWSFFFDRGIVDPVDDFRSTNPPTNPELLAALAKDFRDNSYDLKRLIRTIVQSRTYQASGIPNESNKNDKTDYSHSLPRPLEAAVLLDAITTVNGSSETFEFHSSALTEGGGAAPFPRQKAIQMIPDICPSQFMDAFGRSMRKALPVGPPQPSLPEALDMLAGTTYTTRISQAGGRLDHLLKTGMLDEQIIDEFYLAALTRFPTPREKTALLNFLAQRSARRQETMARLVWAIVSSREFAYNH